MHNYFTYFDKLINNYKNYNLYFAVILLIKIAQNEDIPQLQVLSDIEFLKDIIKSELDCFMSSILDLEDAVLAFTDASIQAYSNSDLLYLMEA